MSSPMHRLAAWGRSSPRRRLVWFGMCIVVGLGGGLALTLLPTAVVFAVVVLGMLWCLFTIRGAAREQGYWEARMEMYESLAEAQLRGISLDDWIKSDMERVAMRAAYGPPSRKMLRLSQKQRNMRTSGS